MYDPRINCQLVFGRYFRRSTTSRIRSYTLKRRLFWLNGRFYIWTVVTVFNKKIWIHIHFAVWTVFELRYLVNVFMRSCLCLVIQKNHLFYDFQWHFVTFKHGLIICCWTTWHYLYFPILFSDLINLG